MTTGGDYKLTNNLILGAAFGYIKSRAELHAFAGHTTMNSCSLSAFGTYYIAKKMYVDGIGTYGWNTYDIERNVRGANETARGYPDGNRFALSVGSWYDFNFGPLSAGPTLRVNYLNVHIDGFQERGAGTSNLKVNSQNLESLTTDLGGQVSYAISMLCGVLSPMARSEWEHEFKNDSRLVTVRQVDHSSSTVSVSTNSEHACDSSSSDAGGVRTIGRVEIA